MNKLDEAKLISYLYNELEREEKKKFEEELKENPEWQQQIDEFRSVRSVISSVKDEHLSEPAFIFPEREKKYMWRHWMSVAATLLMVMIFIGLTGFRANLNNGQLVLGFGEVVHNVVPVENAVSKQEIDQIITDALRKYDGALETRLSRWDEQITLKMVDMTEENEHQIDAAINRLAKAGEEQVSLYLTSMTEDQKSQFMTMLAKHSEDQEEVMKKMFLDFGSFIENQREADLEYLETYISSVQNESRKEQIQTRQFMENIINQVSTRGVAD